MSSGQRGVNIAGRSLHHFALPKWQDEAALFKYTLQLNDAMHSVGGPEGARVEVVSDPSHAWGYSAGSSLWSSGEVLFRELQSARFGASFFRGKTVLELGAGLGVPGIMAAKLGASGVVVTDMEEQVPLLQRNIKQNFQQPQSHTTHTCHTSDVPPGAARTSGGANGVVSVWATPLGGGICAMPLPWGDAEAARLVLQTMEDCRGGKCGHVCGHVRAPDVVLMSDVIYDEDAWTPLVKTLQLVCHPTDTTIILANPQRDELRTFLRMARHGELTRTQSSPRRVGCQDAQSEWRSNAKGARLSRCPEDAAGRSAEHSGVRRSVPVGPGKSCSRLALEPLVTHWREGQENPVTVFSCRFVDESHWQSCAGTDVCSACRAEYACSRSIHS